MAPTFRQQPIETYIVDFVSFEKHITIELDGGQHADQKTKDHLRDKRLTENDYQILYILIILSINFIGMDSIIFIDNIVLYI